MMKNSEKYPEAWKIFVDCVRKWEDNDFEKHSNGWSYGIPNPLNTDEYLFANCPGKLFIRFKDLFYKRNNKDIIEFRGFLNWLERLEGKMSREEYKKRSETLQEYL